MGYPVISADDVNRELLEDKTYLELLKEKFVEAFPSGIFDKKILSSIIFADERRRLTLNSIAHIRIRKLIEDKINAIGKSIIFVEVPILIESGMVDMFDEIIVVTASQSVKIKRVAKRDNIEPKEVIMRMNSQLSDEEILKYATYTIENSGTMDELNENVSRIMKNIIQE